MEMAVLTILCKVTINFNTYDELEVIDGEDKKNFLRGKSPAVLYLWQKVEEADLMKSVT